FGMAEAMPLQSQGGRCIFPHPVKSRYVPPDDINRQEYTVFADKQIWWEAPNSIRIPTGIIVAFALGLRVYGVYRSSKNTPKRSPQVRRIERIVAISLWSFIAVWVSILFLTMR
ncbi:MAG: hypothetical protein ACRD2U_08505, partial [Terriglobales bacterium]